MTTQVNPRKSNPANVIEVNEHDFGEAVLARSGEVPVVVDFWAPWCAPCRTLGPVLERLAEEAKGAFVLAKINVDQNQHLASTYRVQGIPAVKAFRGARVVEEFTGALPESQVRAWLKRVVPSEGDQIVAAAAALEASDPQTAAARYRVVLGSDPTNAAALFGLGRLLVSQGDPEGVATLREIPAGTPFYPRAQAWLTLADFLSQADGVAPSVLAERITGDSGDLDARYRLAAHHTRAQRYEEAIPQLLAIIERNRAFQTDGARRALLAIFEVLGDQSPLVHEGRRRLANALF